MVYVHHQVVRNVRRVLAVCGRSDIPVFMGAEAPLLERRRDASYFHGKVFPLSDVPNARLIFR